MNRFLKWTAGIFGVLLVAAFAVLSFMAGSPKDAYGMVRYALPHMHRGKLKVGSDAPDARIVALGGVSRFQIRDVVQIYEDYKDHADFLTVYVREAHPTDEWQMKSNVKDDVCYAQPKTLEQRVAIANDFTKRFKFPLPFGIDDMSNAANDAYAAWPERIYIIDESGRIAYRGGMGPFNYKPEEAREWLAARYGAVKHEAPQSSTRAVPASTSGAAAPATPAPAASAPVPAAK